MELPHLPEMWEELHDHSDFAMLIVGREETEDTVAAFKAKEGYSFPMTADPGRQTYALFAKQGIPRTYVVSRDGKIVYQCSGFYETELAKLNDLVRNELAKAP
jgi:peroxiredoxin